MSAPRNPLDSLGVSTFGHVLVAFKYAEDAFNYGKSLSFTSKIGNIGTSIEDAGTNVVVVNELQDQNYSIGEAIWNFDYIPSVGVSTSSSVGKIIIDDRYVPYGFLDFLRLQVLNVFNNNEPESNLMSLSHATFMLRTYFTTGSEVIQVNPFFFNVLSIESVPSLHRIGSTPVHHILNVAGSMNSLGVLRSFTSTFQLTLTHKDGNIHDNVPRGEGTNGTLKTRQDENTSNAALRQERLNKSKPMLTLRDVFEALEADLNQLKKSHSAQLQQWIREINSASNTDKIVVSPQQTKISNPEELPIDFTIDLDPLYNDDYLVDNRNMPFEQPDVNQESIGLRVYPIATGDSLYRILDHLMMLSKQVGIDAQSNPRLAFKHTITVIRTLKDRYQVNIKIRRYTLPSNTLQSDTGPGDDFEAPMLFTVNDPAENDVDVYEFKSNINYEVGDKMLERQIENIPGANIVYADREQATAERRPDLPFFQSMYSGLRPMIGSDLIDGLESAERAGDIMNMLDPYTYTQSTDYEMIIRGNPFLLSDLNRNPIDVVNDEEGTLYYYPRPEVLPMYMQLIIYEKSMASGADINIGPFYYTGYYHVTSVVNHFTRKHGKQGDFRQRIEMRRSDDLI